MSTVTRYVSHNLDDAYIYGGSNINTSGFISAGDTTAFGVRDASVIFRNIPIRRGVLINSASVVFTSAGTLSTNNCNTVLKGENSPNPAQFSTYADFAARSETTASVAWNALTTWTIDLEFTTPDITSIIQEIVNRSDWSWGSSIAIRWKNNGSDSDARRAAYGYEDSITKCARITIDYTDTRNLGIKLSNSGINALTDNNPKNFSLYVDGTDDHILVKEQSRGTKSVSSSTTSSNPHGLGYPPLMSAFVEILGGEYQWNYGYSPYSDYRVYVDTTNYYFVNNGASTKTFSYFIFYDKATNTT